MEEETDFWDAAQLEVATPVRAYGKCSQVGSDGRLLLASMTQNARVVKSRTPAQWCSKWGLWEVTGLQELRAHLCIDRMTDSQVSGQLGNDSGLTLSLSPTLSGQTLSGQSCSTLFLKTRSLTEPQARLTACRQACDPPVSTHPSQHWGYMAMPGLYVDSGDLHADPHACTSDLTQWAIPPIQICFEASFLGYSVMTTEEGWLRYYWVRRGYWNLIIYNIL